MQHLSDMQSIYGGPGSVSTPGRALKRAGLATSEAYLQRSLFMSGNADAGFQWAHKVHAPLIISGKTAWHQWSCVQGVGSLLELRHEGLAVTVYVFDRAVLDSLSKKLHQTHEHRRATLQLPPSPTSPTDRDWVFTLGCAVHDAHNALQWAMAMTCDVPSCCSSLRSLLQCLRNWLPIIHEHLGDFLSVHVDFRDGDRDEELCQLYWASLGVGVDWLPLAVALDPVWQHDRLWINPKWRDNKDTLETLVSFYLYCFRFRQATESRWLSIGIACRCVLLSIPLGLPYLLEWLEEHTKVPDHEAKGWSNFFVGEVPLFVALCAFASRIADVAITRLLEDDRVMMVYQDLKDAVELEVSLLQEIPLKVWEWVADAVVPQYGHLELRSTTLMASMTSLGYFSFKVFRHVTACPWRLCLGDVAENLRSIDSLDPNGDDVLCNKIRNLIDQGH